MVEVTKAVQTMRHRQSGITAEDLYKGKVIVKETKKEVSGITAEILYISEVILK